MFESLVEHEASGVWGRYAEPVFNQGTDTLYWTHRVQYEHTLPMDGEGTTAVSEKQHSGQYELFHRLVPDQGRDLFVTPWKNVLSLVEYPFLCSRHPDWNGRLLVALGTESIGDSSWSRTYPVVGYGIAAGAGAIRDHSPMSGLIAQGLSAGPD